MKDQWKNKIKVSFEYEDSSPRVGFVCLMIVDPELGASCHHFSSRDAFILAELLSFSAAELYREDPEETSIVI